MIMWASLLKLALSNWSFEVIFQPYKNNAFRTANIQKSHGRARLI
jgi:hypothetical protein